MNNYITDGKTIDIIAESATSSGDVVLFGGLIGVAINTAEIGEYLLVRIDGVFSLPKEATEAITKGQKIYWNDIDKAISIHKTDNYAGHAFCNANIGDLLVNVKLSLDGINPLGRAIYVNSILDFPEPIGGVITLLAGHSYIITTDIDITPNLISCAGICSIFGISSETSFLRGEVPTGSALISTNYTLPIQNISIEAKTTTGAGKGVVFNIDGGGVAAFDWDALNILDSNVGTILDATNLIITNSAWLNSGDCIIDGTIGTIGISNSIFSPLGGQTVITLPATLTVTRRFRAIYSSFLVFGTNKGLDVNISAGISPENYILDTVNFSGGATYLVGVNQNNVQSLFSNCTGIDNTANVEYYYARANSTTTVITTAGVAVKIAVATTAGTYRQGFTHDNNNKSTFNRALPRFFKISVNYSCDSGNNNQVVVSIYKNGVLAGGGNPITTNGTGRAENGSVFNVLSLAENDYIETFIQNNTGTTNITVSDLDVIIEALN